MYVCIHTHYPAFDTGRPHSQNIYHIARVPKSFYIVFMMVFGVNRPGPTA